MFYINGIKWNVCFVNCDNPILYDYINNVFSVATTDLLTHTIYISNEIYGNFLYKVLKHEIYHCYEFSMTYDFPTYYEEIIADFIANYGEELIDIAQNVYEQITYYE